MLSAKKDVEFVAEIGINHLGDENKAYEMLNKLIKTKIDSITFQIQTNDYYDNTRPFRRKLSENYYDSAIKIVNSASKNFGIAIAEPSEVQFWNEKEINFWKILGADFDNDDLIQKVHSTKKQVYLSTTISSMKEIEEANNHYPSINYVHSTLDREPESANIRAIVSMRSVVGEKVAFGLHNEDPHLVDLAIACGAKTIFFYIREDDDEYYPDYEHAIILNKIDEYLARWKRVEKLLGSGEKTKLTVPEWALE